MPRFKKKPVEVEAVQITEAWFDGTHPNPLHPAGVQIDPVTRSVRVHTPEGVMVGAIGDWIITGVKGEKYPCKPDIFEATYTAVPAVSETPEQLPSVGRIVHYQAYGTPGGEFKSVPRAAVVAEVHSDSEITVCVLNPMGLFFNRVQYSKEPKPGCWNWPPRV